MANLGFTDEDVLRPVRANQTGNEFTIRRTRPTPAQGFRSIGFYGNLAGLPPVTVPNPVMGDNPVALPPAPPEEPAPPAPAPEPAPEPAPTFGDDQNDSGAETLGGQMENVGGAGAVPSGEDFLDAVINAPMFTSPGGALVTGLGMATGAIDPLASNNNYSQTHPDAWKDALATATAQYPNQPQMITTAAANQMGEQFGAGGTGIKPGTEGTDQSGAPTTGGPGAGGHGGYGVPTGPGPSTGPKPTTPTTPSAPTGGFGGMYGGGSNQGGGQNGGNQGSQMGGGATTDPGTRSGGGSMAFNQGGMVRNYNQGGAVVNEAPPPDMDPDQFELQQARAALNPAQGASGHPDAARFQATPGQVADDGVVDNQNIAADEGEVVLRAEAAQNYSPDTLAALNDPELAPQVEQAVQQVLASMQRAPGQVPQAPPSAGAAAMARSAPAPMAARPRSMLARVG